MTDRLDYPSSRREDITETLHGTSIGDPYRWLEDPDSAETAAWVKEQNELSSKHLADLRSREWFQDQLAAIVLRPRAGVPYEKAGRFVLSRNDGTQQQDEYVVADSLAQLQGGGRLLIDTNELSADGTTSLAGYTISDDGHYFAYLVSVGGSDWHDIRVLDLRTGTPVEDTVTNSKFSLPTWLPDCSSYLYLHFPTSIDVDGTTPDALGGGQLRLHRLGTPQQADQVILEFPGDPQSMPWPVLSHDGRWLAAHISRGTERSNRLWLYPISADSGRSVVGEPTKLVDDESALYEFIRCDGELLFLRTDADAPNGKVVTVDLRTKPLEFHDLIASKVATLEMVTAAGAEILAVYLSDAQPELRRFGLDGSLIGVVPIDVGAVLTVNSHVDDHDVYVGVSSATTPLESYHLDLESGAVTLLSGLAIGGSDYQPPEVVTERRRAVSIDGTEVPYFLIRRADLALSEARPTLLYGYGGFNIPVLADYRAGWPAWLAAGGVLAIANLRGGGEYGSSWHDAGRLHNKQNVFDDFIAIAEQLKDDGVTTTEQLAIHGRSNGGLLVGAVMTQRPDLAQVALPMVGVLDLLRFHLFTIGSAWISDYGSPDDQAFFQTLLAYSPLHNVRAGTAYPATLVLTGDHDDRVVPAHSFKYVAALQQAQTGARPILARIEVATGHGMGKPATMQAAEWADLLAFAADHTGLRPE